MSEPEQSRAVARERSGHVAEPDVKMLEMLVCPVTRGTLHWDRGRNELVSRSARLAYPIRGGVPIMLGSEARPLEDAEIEALR